MDAFIAQWQWVALLLIMIVEFLIGSSKLKSNSTIELVVNIIKFVFRIDQKK